MRARNSNNDCIFPDFQMTNSLDDGDINNFGPFLSCFGCNLHELCEGHFLISLILQVLNFLAG